MTVRSAKAMSLLADLDRLESAERETLAELGYANEAAALAAIQKHEQGPGSKRHARTYARAFAAVLTLTHSKAARAALNSQAFESAVYHALHAGLHANGGAITVADGMRAKEQRAAGRRNLAKKQQEAKRERQAIADALENRKLSKSAAAGRVFRKLADLGREPLPSIETIAKEIQYPKRST